MENKKLIFEVGDEVYGPYGIGEVTFINEDYFPYLYNVKFDYNDSEISLWLPENALSFSPIEVNHERPAPPLKKRDLVTCWDDSKPENKFVGRFYSQPRANLYSVKMSFGNILTWDKCELFNADKHFPV